MRARTELTFFNHLKESGHSNHDCTDFSHENQLLLTMASGALPGQRLVEFAGGRLRFIQFVKNKGQLATLAGLSYTLVDQNALEWWLDSAAAGPAEINVHRAFSLVDYPEIGSGFQISACFGLKDIGTITKLLRRMKSVTSPTGVMLVSFKLSNKRGVESYLKQVADEGLFVLAKAGAGRLNVGAASTKHHLFMDPKEANRIATVSHPECAERLVMVLSSENPWEAPPPDVQVYRNAEGTTVAASDVPMFDIDLKKASIDDICKIAEKISQMLSTGLRVYKTRNGWRLLSTSLRVHPAGLVLDKVLALSRLGVDARHLKMCLAVNLWRTRVQPKATRLSNVWLEDADYASQSAAWATCR